MITYSKKKFRKIVITATVILLLIIGLLYTNGYIGDNSIPYYKALLSFVVTMILFDPQTYLSIKNYSMNKDVTDVQSISYKYMIVMSSLIIVVSTILFIGSIKWFGGVFGIASVIYIMLVLMTIIYNISFKLSEIK